MHDILFSYYKLNKYLTLKNRIVMAPMTRNMADDNLVPTQAMAEYYARRADAGLIITEGTIICRETRAYTNVPGIYTEDQIKGWQRVSDAVHAQKGCIFLQIWHSGRVNHPFYLNGELPISCSETSMTGVVKRNKELFYGKSRAANINEINNLIEYYAQAASNAIKAGFDGIEIHGANGYLIDQFLHYHTNLRNDEYGATPENMSRFALEVVKACGQAIGYERVGIRLSPGAYLNQIVGDERDGLIFRYLIEQLNHLPIAYIHTGNFDDSKKFSELNKQTMTTFIRTFYQGTLIACGGYTLQQAKEGIEKNLFDLIAIGKPFIANHNLIHLVKQNLPFKNYDETMLEILY